jgi:hypothetical protein
MMLVAAHKQHVLVMWAVTADQEKYSVAGHFSNVGVINL